MSGHDKSTSKVKWLIVLLALSWSSLGHAGEGHDFVAEARLLYRVVACGADSALPAGFDTKVVATHCREQKKRNDRLARRYVTRARPFLARLRPAGLPDRVVYPFGGGDLLTALVTYPDAKEYTTVSLEHSGDPRRLAALAGPELKSRLEIFRGASEKFMRIHDHMSENLRTLESGPIPGQLTFFMIALAVNGYEPVGLEFFRIEKDGSLHYYGEDEIAVLEPQLAARKSKNWIDTDYSVAFSHAELAFRKIGDPSAPIRVHRHIVFNLANSHFADSPLLAHLKQKGRVSAMTKAASYLLWNRKFAVIREYLLGNMAFMISDSSGIPPKYARAAGFRQRTYGTFEGALLEYARKSRHNQPFIDLWQAQKQRKLPFRYGYVDVADHAHLLITEPRRRRKP